MKNIISYTIIHKHTFLPTATYRCWIQLAHKTKPRSLYGCFLHTLVSKLLSKSHNRRRLAHSRSDRFTLCDVFCRSSFIKYSFSVPFEALAQLLFTGLCPTRHNGSSTLNKKRGKGTNISRNIYSSCNFKKSSLQPTDQGPCRVAAAVV